MGAKLTGAELNAAPPHGADQEIQSRLWDLLPVVRNHVYHPRFAGSFSLKDVLPALVPEMTYGGMEIANGQDAGLAWESLVRGIVTEVTNGSPGWSSTFYPAYLQLIFQLNQAKATDIHLGCDWMRVNWLTLPLAPRADCLTCNR